MSESAPSHTPHTLRRRFRRQMVESLSLATLGMLVTLGIGTVGYRWLGGLSWVDAVLNASMLLGGMGPVNELTGDAAKLFAAAYALYCGIFFIASMGLLLAPVMNHILHRFHLDRALDRDGESG